MASAEGIASGMHHVVEDLREQLARYQSLPDTQQGAFTFSITSDEARDAIDAFHRTSCAAESTLDRFVTQMVAPGLDRILVTYGVCPTLQARPPTPWYVRRTHVIGQEIPHKEYEDVLATPDQRLADAFPPTCAFCPSDEMGAVKHPSVLSYTRHVHPRLVPTRIQLDDIESITQGLLYSAVGFRANGLIEDAQGIETLIARNTDMKRHVERELVNVAHRIGHPAVQAKTRVKGIGRLAQKILRAVLDDESARDWFGVQIAVLGDELAVTERYAKGIAQELRARDPGAIIQDVHYDVSSHGQWEGYKAYARYDDLPISLQFIDLSRYFVQRDDHPHYEERQRQKFSTLQDTGVPVDRMLAAIESELSRAATEWRLAHSSS
jgi:hypothetical protein